MQQQMVRMQFVTSTDIIWGKDSAYLHRQDPAATASVTGQHFQHSLDPSTTPSGFWIALSGAKFRVRIWY